MVPSVVTAGAGKRGEYEYAIYASTPFTRVAIFSARGAWPRSALLIGPSDNKNSPQNARCLLARGCAETCEGARGGGALLA